MTFISFREEIYQLILNIVSSNQIHAKWLNTLSYLENCGARKIAEYEHPTLVKEELLKHAAEEFRHAHYLKKQIEKLSFPLMKNYAPNYLLGGITTIHYLNSLNVQICRYLKQMGFIDSKLKSAAYVLVTYAIECRAAELYPIYDKILKQIKSPIKVKSILLEEQGHLNEMEHEIELLNSGRLHAAHVCTLEANLCKNWLVSIRKNLQ